MSYEDYPDLTKTKRILVIKLRNLGDVLLVSPVFRSLKRYFPKAAIDAFIYRESLPILEKNPFIRSCLTYDQKWKQKNLYQRWKNELSLLRTVRKNRYDLVINLTESDRGAIVTKISGASCKVGYNEGTRRKRKVYSHLAKICAQRHTVEKNFDALRRIGLFPKEEDAKLLFTVEPTTIDAMKKRLRFNTPFLLVHPASRWRFKCWPTTKMQSLIEQFLWKNIPVVLVCGKDPVEKKMIEKIVGKIKHPNLHDFSGKTSLEELGALICLSTGFLCMDSVGFHMANALQANVAVLFGPTSPIAWGPWKNPYAKVVRNNFPCMPCYTDGCGGSKVSECLVKLPVKTVFAALQPFFPSLDPMQNETLDYVQ